MRSSVNSRQLVSSRVPEKSSNDCVTASYPARLCLAPVMRGILFLVPVPTRNVGIALESQYFLRSVALSIRFRTCSFKAVFPGFRPKIGSCTVYLLTFDASNRNRNSAHSVKPGWRLSFRTRLQLFCQFQQLCLEIAPVVFEQPRMILPRSTNTMGSGSPGATITIAEERTLQWKGKSHRPHRS
jgi:hypothetical protein